MTVLSLLTSLLTLGFTVSTVSLSKTGQYEGHGGGEREGEEGGEGRGGEEGREGDEGGLVAAVNQDRCDNTGMSPGKKVKLFLLKFLCRAFYLPKELLLVSFSIQLTWKLSKLLSLVQPVGYHGDEVIFQETSS